MQDALAAPPSPQMARRELAVRAKRELAFRAKLLLANRKLFHYAALQYPSYKFAKLHEQICAALEKINSGEITRLMIFAPPQYAKTTWVSELFASHFIGRNPEKSVIAATYSAERAFDVGRKVRNAVQGDLFRAIFPAAQLADDSAAVNRFNTTAGGAYYSVGVGGAVTGRRADIFICDDLIKGAEDASSATYRQRAKDWYAQVAYTRLSPKGAIILIMTRWHVDDIPGWLLNEHKHENWEVLNFPAISDDGSALWPERHTLEKLEQIKLSMGSRAFQSLFMQAPTMETGNIFKREFWKYYKELPLNGTRKILSCDTAFKAKDGADFSAAISALETPTGIYITGMYCKRVEFPELKRDIKALHDANGYDAVLVEDKASGQSLIQELKRETSMPIIPVKVDVDKVSRANAAVPFIEAGNVYLPENAPWVFAFVEECAEFPGAPHDDRVDALTQLVNWAKKKTRVNFGVVSAKEEKISDMASTESPEWDFEEEEAIGGLSGRN